MDNNEENKKSLANIFKFAVAKPNVPEFSEFEGRREWIPYGKDNLYPDFLVDLANGSTKHNALIVKETNMTAGNGFVESESNKEFLSNPNGKEDLDTIVFKNAYDLSLYGAYALIITWSVDRKSIARITYGDIRKIRIAKDFGKEIDPELKKRQSKGVEYYYISPDWSNTRKEKNKPKLVQGFSEKYNDVATQIIYVKQYRSGTDWYTLPQYISAVNWITVDKEIANFHLSSIQNGFTPSMVISFTGGIPSDEEMDKVYTGMKKKYAGTNQGSEIIITFAENPETAPTFTPIQLNASDERFLQLEESTQTNIIVAHGASPIVAGIATAGKLGSSAEIFEAELVFRKNVIDVRQNIIEKSYNKLGDINGLVEKLELEGIDSIEEMEGNEEEVTMESIVRKITIEQKTEEDGNK